MKRVYKRWVLKGTHGFSENGQFARRGKDGKALVKKPLSTSVSVTANKEESDQSRKTNELIEVFLLRDESDEEVGGVNKLQTGDLYWRDPEFDSDQRPFSWTGEKVEEGRHYTKAVFQRYNTISHGKGA